MAKKAFAFALGQRVNVPGKKNVQGVVSLPKCVNEFCVPSSFPASATLYPFIFLRWLTEEGEATFAWFAEPDVSTANAPTVGVVGIDVGGKDDTVGTAALILTRIKGEWRKAKRSAHKPARRRKSKR